MTNTLRNTFAISAIVVAALVAMTIAAVPAHANPSQFVRAQTAPATTTLTYLTPGTATTTLAINGVSNTAFDSAVVNFCLTASSTSSTINMGTEYSQDGQTWYADEITVRATTTPATLSATVPNTFSYTYASTTPGGAATSATSNTGCKTVPLLTPEKYARVFFTVPVGATNGAVWAEIVAKQQAN